jgi:hypothetical protein
MILASIDVQPSFSAAFRRCKPATRKKAEAGAWGEGDGIDQAVDLHRLGEVGDDLGRRERMRSGGMAMPARAMLRVSGLSDIVVILGFVPGELTESDRLPRAADC